MTPTPFPIVAAWTLPAEALQTPPPAAAPAPEEVETPTAPDPNTAVEAIAPLISAVIARRARQRRYTG